jgi:Nidogen-like
MTGETRSSARTHARFSLATALVVAATAVAAIAWPAGAAAADCGCSLTGDYKQPEGKNLSITADGKSPQGKYQVTAVSGGGNLVNLTVERVSGNATVLSLSGVPAGAWGFSPDADRFVYHYVSGGVHNVGLYDLTASSPSTPKWQTAVATGSSRIRFSPNGKYLLYAYAQSATFTNLVVVNATTGAQRHTAGFTYAIPPGSPGDSFGVAVWGFSPDDRTFFYSRTSGQSSVDWTLVNLEGGATGRIVKSETTFAISALWSFSPCGDVFGIVEQTSQSFLSARLFKTADGQTLASQSGLTFSPNPKFTVKPSTNKHVLVRGTDELVLASNTANVPCPATGPSLTSVSMPTSVTGGNSVTGTVTLSSSAPAGGIQVALQSSSGVASTPANVLVPQGASTRTFSVTTNPVSASANVTISASYNGVTRTDTLAVNPAPVAPALASLTLSPTSVQGGTNSTATATLSAAAPAGGVNVSLASADSSLASVPASVFVAGGQTSGTFLVSTNGVSSTATVAISATAGGASRSANLTVTPAPSGGTNAIDPNPGCAANALPRNDDGSSTAITLPFNVNFFGSTYTFLFVNNNGNVTFNQPLARYTPFRITAATPPIIAPFLADVDTRSGDSDVVRYSFGSITYAGRPAFCVNWIDVGYFSHHTDKLNSFQLILVDRSDVDQGDFDIVMNYGRILWETGDASGGSNGLGGTSAGAGYSAGTGNAAQFYEFPGSLVNGALLDSNAARGLTRTSRNSTVLGRHIFEVRNGAAPAGGTVEGLIKDRSGNPLPGAPVQICRVSGGLCVFVTLANAAGRYTATGITEGDYLVTAYPPAGSSLMRASAGPVHASPGTAVSQDVVLSGPTPPPPGTSITPSTQGGGGIPTVYYGNPLDLTTTGCPGGSASWQVLVGGSVVASGAMTEGPAGTYSGQIPPLRPNVGLGTVRIAIDCPGGTPDETVEFNVYIDPSGLVLTPGGLPVYGATVTLYRSDSPAGPFEVVPAGSFVMSPANRRNPDLTDEIGHFGWDVIAGYYKVRAEKEGCTSTSGAAFVESGVLTIPPPVTDLDLRLDCPDEAEADELAPITSVVASPGANAAGWNRGPVTVALSASDEEGGSGVASIEYSLSGADSGGDIVDGQEASVVIDAEGVTTLTYRARDLAGNVEAEQAIVVRIDLTAPTITIVAPEGRRYEVGAIVQARYACVDTLAGLTGCAGPLADGEALDTDEVGEKSFTVEASDKAGNGARATVVYRVGYRICLLEAPKEAKAGSTIPWKLQVCAADGRNLSAQSLVVTALGVDDALTAAPGGSQPGNEFRYVADDGGSYHYNLKTSGLSPGTHVFRFRVAGDPEVQERSFTVR